MDKKYTVKFKDITCGALIVKDEVVAFEYAKEYLERKDAHPISLTLPLREKPYESETILPFFDGLLPEGWISDRVKEIFPFDPYQSKDTIVAEMLSYSCKDCVGAVSFGDFNMNFQRIEKRDRNIDTASFDAFSRNIIAQGATVPGFQKKTTAHLVREKFSNEFPFDFIIKPQSPRFNNLPENEFLIMSMARDIAHIPTVDFDIIGLKDQKAYITRRIDRITDKVDVEKIPMEDFSQLLGKLADEKYDGDYLSCMEVIDKYCVDPMKDKTALFRALIFSCLIVNNDLHLKNLSLIEKDGKYSLTPFYDLVSSAPLFGEDCNDLAMPLEKEYKDYWNRKDFLAFAKASKIPLPSAEKIIDKLLSKIKDFEGLITSSLLSEEQKRILIRSIHLRKNNLTKEKNN